MRGKQQRCWSFGPALAGLHYTVPGDHHGVSQVYWWFLSHLGHGLYQIHVVLGLCLSANDVNDAPTGVARKQLVDVVYK